MAEGFRVAVLGATGLVGQQMIEILQQRDFPVAQLYPLASARSVGATVSFKGEDVEVIDAETFDWSEADIGFISAGGEISKEVWTQKICQEHDIKKLETKCNSSD